MWRNLNNAGSLVQIWGDNGLITLGQNKVELRWQNYLHAQDDRVSLQSLNSSFEAIGAYLWVGCMSRSHRRTGYRRDGAKDRTQAFSNLPYFDF